MKHYIIHNDALTERRESLQKQLDKFGITDVEWVTTFPANHPFVYVVKERLSSVLPLGYISCSLKHYDALRRIVNEGIQEAIVFEDDVIISDFYDESKLIQYPYIKLGRGPPDCQLSLGSTPHKVPNPGGSEAYYVTADFAREYLKNVTFMENVDMEQYSFLLRSRLLPICIPMCYQEFNTSFEHKFGSKSNDFIVDYCSGKIPFFNVLKELDNI
jgi:hypothetical protein